MKINSDQQVKYSSQLQRSVGFETGYKPLENDSTSHIYTFFSFTTSQWPTRNRRCSLFAMLPQNIAACNPIGKVINLKTGAAESKNQMKDQSSTCKYWICCFLRLKTPKLSGLLLITSRPRPCFSLPPQKSRPSKLLRALPLHRYTRRSHQTCVIFQRPSFPPWRALCLDKPRCAPLRQQHRHWSPCSYLSINFSPPSLV